MVTELHTSRGSRKGRGEEEWPPSETAFYAQAHSVELCGFSAQIEGCSHGAQGSGAEKRLAQLEGEAKGENADQKDSYLSDLEALAHRTRSKIQVGLAWFRAGHQTGDSEMLATVDPRRWSIAM